MNEYPMDEAKVEALAAHLDLSDDEIEYTAVGENQFSLAGCEYLILTDAEADEAAEEEILRSLWAFNAEWLTAYMPLPVRAIRAIQEVMYEDASEAFEALLGDKVDRFVAASIGADGRGHFLAGYDGEEIELNGGAYYAYRVD